MISLFDFPETKIYVLLEEEFRKLFFSSAFDIIGGRKELAKFLGVGYTAVNEWFHGYKKRSKNKITVQYCPIKAIKRIATLNFKDVNLVNDVEKHITSYRSWSGACINKPILPISENYKLLNIIAHILGDGSFTEHSMPYFSNSYEELRKEFIKNLNIFGKVEYLESFSSETPRVFFPTAIIHILRKKYKIDFKNKNFLDSSIIFNLPKDLICSFLKGIFDDEGYVSDSNVQICSSKKKLLFLSRELLNRLDIMSSKIFRYQEHYRKDGSISKVYYFDIYSNDLEKFQNLINFTHPKKREFLESIIKRKNRKWKYPNSNSIINIILNELEKNKTMTARDLSIKTMLSARNLRKNYLYSMERNNLITRFGKRRGKGGANLWKLNKQIHLNY